MLVTKDRTMWPLTRYLTPYLTRFLIKRQFVTCHSFQRQFRKNSSVSGVSLCISLPTVPSSLYLPFLHPHPLQLLHCFSSRSPREINRFGFITDNKRRMFSI